MEQMHSNDDNRYRRRRRRRPGVGHRSFSSGPSMRLAVIVLLALTTQHASPRTGLRVREAATISAAVCAAAAAPQTSSDLEGDVAGGSGGGDGGAGAGNGAGTDQGETVASETTSPADTTTDIITGNDSSTASTDATPGTTSAGSQSTVQENGALGLFRQLQEKFQQMIHQSPQNQQTQTETAQEQMERAQKLKEEQLRKQQQRWSMGLTNPSINIGPGLPRKSRRRVLYESSIRSHYTEKTGRGDGNDNYDVGGEMTSSSDRNSRQKIDARKTIAALILGGRGEVVWESGDDSSISASIDADSKRLERARSRPRADRKMEGCAYYSPSFGGKKDKKQGRLPYWNYRICPGRSIEQFHVDLRKKMTIEELGLILEEDAQNQSGSASSGGIEETTSTTEHTNGATIQYITLGKQIAPTLSPNSSILSDEFHQQAKLWKDSAPTGSGGSREGFDKGRGRLVQVPLSSYDQSDGMGEVSYYTGGAQCGKKTNLQERMTRLVILEGCCPESDSIPAPLFRDASKSNLRIMSIAEPRMCRYNVLACFDCPRTDEEDKTEEEDVAALGNDQNGATSSAVRKNVEISVPGDSATQKKAESGLSNVGIGLDQKQRSVISCDSFCQEATESHTRRMPSESSGFDKASTYRQTQTSDAVSSSFPPFPPSKAQANLDVLRQMFQRSYDSYMYNAYPTGELKPISCKPGTFDLIRLPALTLIDSLDTMVIMRNFTEFARSVERLRALDETMMQEFSRVFPNFVEPLGLPDRNGGLFGVNQNVSLFETNIRVLGGLLSAHQLAEAFIFEGSVAAHDVWDENGDIRMGSSSSPKEVAAETPVDTESVPTDDASCPSDDQSQRPSPPCTDVDYVQDIGKCKKIKKKQNATTKKEAETIQADASSSTLLWQYDGFLLTLAHDLGIRLLTAFSTETGIPYGTVNLLYGIPPGETSVASLAGGGTLSIEMELLSRLTGDERFGQAARLATRALWGRRSNNFDLLGKHIDVHSGQWRESLSGIGSNSDSFYEYLIKHHILFPDDGDYYDLWTMFRTSYSGVFYDNRQGDWYGDVDMMGGRQSGIRQVFESLMAFWPGMQVLLGELNPAARSTNAFSLVREFLGLLPERFNFGEWRVDGGGGVSPLRPELLESIYFLHMATLGLNANGYNSQNNVTDQSTSTGWQWASDFALSTLDQWTRTDCPAHATVKAVDHRTTGSVLANFLQSTNAEHLGKNTGSSHTHLHDDMPSYFLSETIKYLFLTFEGNENILNQDHQRDWVFTTEAHPVHHVPWPREKIFSRLHQHTKDDDSVEIQDGGGNDEGYVQSAQLRVLDLLAIKLASSEKGEEDAEEVSTVIPSTDLKPQQRNEMTLNEEGSKWTAQTSFTVFNQVISAVNNIIASNRQVLYQQGISQNASIWTFDHEHHLTPHVVARSSFWPNAALVDEAVVDNELQVENLSTVTTYRLGRGDGSTLSQTCPNLHHPDLRWVAALNGESLDYGEGFVTFMSDVMTSNIDMESRSALALSSAASYGIEQFYASASLPSTSSCRAIKPQLIQDAATKEEPSVFEDSRNEQIQERGLDITRFDMGAPLGLFDVAVLTQEVGFYVKHVASSNSIEATIFDDPAGGPTGVMVVADVPPPKPKHKEVDHFPSIHAGRRCHWNAHLSRRDKLAIPTTKVDSDESMQITLPYQRRKTLFASSDSEMAFRCTVELVQILPPNETVTSEVNVTVAVLPCSPALFGPTNITVLAESGGLTFEGSLSPPESGDESGCKMTPKASPNDPRPSANVERSREATIQLVRRGKCRFQTKIANQVRTNLANSGVIVINSDPSIFVMSGGCVQGDGKCEKEDAEGTLIPSVMIGHGDGIRMMNFAEDVRQKGGKLHAMVSLLPQQALDTKGNDASPISDTESTTKKITELPAVSMSSAAVQIYAPGGWGIHAAKKVASASGEGVQQQEQEEEIDAQDENIEEKDDAQKENDNGSGSAEEPQKAEWQLFILQHQTS